MYPLEQVYQNLQEFNIPVNRDELEQVEQLRYNLNTLQAKSLEVSSNLNAQQYRFKEDLDESIKQFDITQKKFC